MPDGNLLEEGARRLKRGDFLSAARCLRQACEADPKCALARANLGIALHHLGQYREALEHYEAALSSNPNWPELHNNLGNTLHQLGRDEAAAAHYAQALRLRPDYAEAHNNLANILKSARKLEEAIPHYRRALEIQPDYADAAINLAMLLQGQGQNEEAVGLYRRALAREPDSTEALHNLALLLQQQGDLAEAVALYHRVLEVDPQRDADYTNLGVCRYDQGQIKEAMACWQRALKLNPDQPAAHWNRALAWLWAGNYEYGWSEFEWRWKLDPLPLYHQSPWDGRPFPDRTLLLFAEQGLGDTLHFVRYAALAKERGGRVILLCQPSLVRLLRTGPGIDEVLPFQANPPPSDWQVPLLSLPRVFKTTLDNVPHEIPYLYASQTPPGAHPPEQPRRPRVGLVWEGSRICGPRVCPLASFLPLLKRTDVAWVSLQKGVTAAQLAALAPGVSIQDWGRRFDDFMDTAEAVAQLDLVISIDTSVAHLAGAMGKPLWVVLPVAPLWRWLGERTDSPWYPTARLFRQRKMGDWAAVMEEVDRALNDWVR